VESFLKEEACALRMMGCNTSKLGETLGMGSRLDRITDWKRAARTAGYHVDALAKRVGVTGRQLERYFEKQKRFGGSPKKWVDGLRMADSRNDLRQGIPIKEVAARRGFKHVQDFTRAFGRVYGVKPSDARSKRSP
jgi:transcriptional regulator GlxA family with amidase domain